MLRKIILSKQKPVQLIIAMFGAFFGLLLLLSSLQIYSDISFLLSGKSDAVQSQFLVINKSVSFFNTFKLTKAEFSEKEISELRQQPFIQAVGSFQSGLFSTKAYIDPSSTHGFPPLYTDLFFESLPDAFLDVKPSGWHWQEGSTTLPIIVPSDYINLYNFGFAPSQGLPQLSRKTIGMASFKISINGQGKTQVFDARIADFTDRINTILVPAAFMEYANKEFGSHKKTNPSRLVIRTANASSPELIRYLSEHDYETNVENLRNGKMQSLLTAIMNVCLVIGAVIILLSLLGFIQYAQLIIYGSAYELKTLMEIGYSYRVLWGKYFRFYAWVLSGVFVFAFLFLKVSKNYFDSFMETKGFTVDSEIVSSVYICGLVLFLLLLFVNGLNFYFSLRKLAKPR